jgi:signal transduction histidine kinase
MFKLFAELIGFQLHSQQQMAATHAALLNEREASQLREQFIAVLGHDLRNPLGAINSGVELLRMVPMPQEDLEILDIIKRSTRRMSVLIDNVLDFARGRLGGGISLSMSAGLKLEIDLKQVLAELRSTSPGRRIESTFRIHRAFACDSPKLAQMLSNLVANALTHGDPEGPVWVDAETTTDGFNLSVRNLGPRISPETMERLFHPFVRGAVRQGQQGLGLGLYIASQIAEAHHGKLGVTSENGEICFTFEMPIG